jgi:glycosyltransferase involved in cell wall biosynthesis
MRALIFSPMVRYAMKHYLQCIQLELDKAGIHYETIVPAHSEVVGTQPVHKIGGGGKVGVVWANVNPITYIKILAAFIKARPSLIHVLNGENRVTTLFLLLLARLKGVPTYLALHDPEPHPCARLDKLTFWLGKLSIRLATDICIHEEAHRPIVQKWQKPIHVYPFPDIATIFPSAQTSERRQEVLFFGRIEPYKGLHNFVQVAVKLGGKAKFVIAGSGQITNEVQSVIDQYPSVFEVHNRVVTDEEMLNFFDRAKVVLLPYDSATQSGIPAGAASRGAIPVGFAVGGLTHQIPEVGGLVCPAGDIEALVTVVEQCLDGTLAPVVGGGEASRKFSSGLQAMYHSSS